MLTAECIGNKRSQAVRLADSIGRSQLARVEERVTIYQPINTVFDFVLNGTNNPLWRLSVTDVQLDTAVAFDCCLGVGTIFKQGLRGPGGGRIDGDYEIIACQLYDLIQFQVIGGPVRPIGTYHFEALGDSTMVTFSLQYDVEGLPGLIKPLIARQMQMEVRALGNLKTFLEKHRTALLMFA